MTTYTRTGYLGNGALFKSSHKEFSHQPDYNGDCEIEGNNYRLVAWVKTDKHGAKFLSIGVRSYNPPAKDGGEDLF